MEQAISPGRHKNRGWTGLVNELVQTIRLLSPDIYGGDEDFPKDFVKCLKVKNFCPGKVIYEDGVHPRYRPWRHHHNQAGAGHRTRPLSTPLPNSSANQTPQTESRLVGLLPQSASKTLAKSPPLFGSTKAKALAKAEDHHNLPQSGDEHDSPKVAVAQ